MSDNKLKPVDFKPAPKNGATASSRGKPKKKLLQPQSSKSSIGWDDVPPDDSFSSYMHHKNRKLREQFTSEFSKPASRSDTKIFQNVVVWVNGHTNPTRLHIRRIMGLHGGRLETYLTDRVTHVVATNLATATRLRFTNQTNAASRVKLVSPQWITDSLTQGKRLPEPDYPIPLMTDPTQRSVDSFFAPKRAQTDKQSVKQTPTRK